MKKALIQFILQSILIFSSAFFCFISCNSKLPVLDLEKARDGLIEIDNRFRNYSDIDCIFLKGSSSLVPSDICNAYCSGNDLYLLFPNLLLYYNLFSGDLLFEYKPLEPVNFTDFVFDVTSSKAYILDKKASQILELAMNGEIIKKIKLDSANVYSTINRISGRRFLLTRQTVPYPSFDIVDFDTDKIQEYIFNTGKKTKTIPESSDSIWRKYPLYVTDETPNGINVKYLLDDRVFRFSDNRLTTNYIMKMGKQKVKLKYPWSVTKLKNNDRFRIIKFWQANNKTYILSQKIVKNVRGTFDSKGLSQFLDFKSVEPFCNFLAKVNLTSLMPSKDEIFMDNKRDRFLSIRKLRHEEKEDSIKWPKCMLEASNKGDMVVSIFKRKL